MSITVTGDTPYFRLAGPKVEYRFHVDSAGDLVHDHFGAPTGVNRTRVDPPLHGWGSRLNENRREFPDHGRGDFRLPAIRVRHGEGRGHTTTRFAYVSHSVQDGKPPLEGLPATFGELDEVSTLIVHLEDAKAKLAVDLRYSIFPATNAIVRSFSITNNGAQTAEIERAASFSFDLDVGEWDMVYMSGDWTREGIKGRRRVGYGTQGFQSSTGYSSHYHNPFVAVVDPETTDTHGFAYGLSFVYTGSFSVDVEKYPAHDRTRVMMGLNPLHLSWALAPGASFHSPEVCAVYEHTRGINGMSRSFHTLYRNHLSRSKFTKQPRPVLINNWEATYFDIDAKKLQAFAERAAKLDIRMFVMDDGWFGVKKPRVKDNAGLGDWVPNPARFPDGMEAFASGVTALQCGKNGEKLKFGIWVEPEMINRTSELYDRHPEWVLQVEGYDMTEQRDQLVLDLGKTEVQDYIIECLSKILEADISYVKWDNNRGMHEIPHASQPHAYILGLYRVLDTLIKRFPDVLWEGCASGGGRFDAGLLYYWPQHWTSDNTDALERLAIQFGTSLVYPPSSMACHVSACPNEQVMRTTPLHFRAHVALMGGSFGFELDLAHLTDGERAAIPGIVNLAERVNPLVINGDQHRLVLPEDSNWPAVMYLSTDGSQGILLAYQIREVPRCHPPALRLSGLDPEATYKVQEEGSETVETLSGAVLMHDGLWLHMHGDFDSKAVWLTKQ